MIKAIERKGDTPHDRVVTHKSKEFYRLNKFISDSGYCSRRAADRLVADGLVLVDGEIAQLGQKIYEGQRVCVEGHDLNRSQDRVYIMLNKPRGITCTTDLDIAGNISEFMNYPSIIFPIGRLDKDSSGLILLTNDGDVVNKILREENSHDKEYHVVLENTISDTDLKKMAQGVQILNAAKKEYQVTKQTNIQRIDAKSYTITLDQGLNRQIRRMATAVGAHVVELQRVRMMHLYLGDLKIGEWRYLNQEEMEELDLILANSTSEI